MITALDPTEILARFSEQQLAGYFLVLGRISPLFLLAPLFSSKQVPARVRTIVALGLTVGIAPIALHDAPSVPVDALGYAMLMVKEVLVGMAFAFAVGTLFAAISAAGNMADTLVGFSYGSTVDPVFGNQGGALSQLYSLVGLMIFVVINGDQWVIGGLARSYELLPLTTAPDLSSLAHGAQIAFGGILGAAVEVCAPVMLAVLLTDVAFGLVAKVMPQLNVFAVGFPAKVTVGLLVIGASLPFVGNWVADGLHSSVADALRMLRVAP